MTEETTAADYEKGIELLEAELARLEEIKSLDTRTQERILNALEDLKRKAAAAK
jgi:argininosuccinate lyase